MVNFKDTLYKYDCLWYLITSLVYFLFYTLNKFNTWSKLISNKYLEKVTFYYFYIIIEILATIFMIMYTIPNVMSMVRSITVVKQFDIKVLPTEEVILVPYFLSIIFTTCYIFEVFYHKDIRAPLVVHHVIVVINTIIANISIRVISQEHLSLAVFYSLSLMLLHATFDWLLHIPLLLRRVNAPWVVQCHGYFVALFLMVPLRLIINSIVIDYNWCLYNMIQVTTWHKVWMWWIHITIILLSAAQLYCTIPFIHMWLNRPTKSKDNGCLEVGTGGHR